MHHTLENIHMIVYEHKHTQRQTHKHKHARTYGHIKNKNTHTISSANRYKGRSTKKSTFEEVSSPKVGNRVEDKDKMGVGVTVTAGRR